MGTIDAEFFGGMLMNDVDESLCFSVLKSSFAISIHLIYMMKLGVYAGTLYRTLDDSFLRRVRCSSEFQLSEGLVRS